MVPRSSDRISRVPPYLICPHRALSHTGLSPISPSIPAGSANSHQARLVRVRSPLLTEYRLISFPPGTEMFQFPAFALLTLYIQVKSTCFNRRSCRPRRDVPTGQGPARSAFAAAYNNRRLSGGFPHSDIPGSKGALASPGLIAECHVLHRLLLPRHPPNALIALDPIQKKTGPFA